MSPGWKSDLVSTLLLRSCSSQSTLKRPARGIEGELQMSLMIIILYLKELLNGELTVFFFIHDDFRDDDFFTESPWRLCLILCICSHSQVLAKMLKTHQNEWFQQILNKILCFTQEVTFKMKLRFPAFGKQVKFSFWWEKCWWNLFFCEE